MTVYCDTSIVTSYYCAEKLSHKVNAMLQELETPAISPLVEVEFNSAVALKIRIKELDAAGANQILSMFQLHIDDSFYRYISIEEKEYHLAKEWISRFSVPLRTLDALHLAAAFSNDLELLTSDKQLARAAVKLGVKNKLIN